jgi:signal transduction histidine kinase
MKLLNRYNRITLATTIIVMLITGVIYYGVISWILTGEVDKDLVVEENEVFNYVKQNHQLPQPTESGDQQISFIPVTGGTIYRKFIDTAYFDKSEKENESGRGLVSSVNIGSRYYKILIVESKVETEELIRIIFFITAIVILLLLIILYATNRLLLNRLWQPFYKILGDVRAFNVADKNEFKSVKSDTDEFEELNTAVIHMASRVRHDYKDLKRFTENASHELLTPIAVINSKLDTLLQTAKFNDEESKLFNDLYTAVNRLNRLNQSLLLLAKIENKLEHKAEQIDLREALEEIAVQFEELFQEKRLTVDSILTDKSVYASRYLMDILLNNLISNAIRHNYIGGRINITVTEASLTVSNTGEKLPLDERNIYKRFQKSAYSEGTGLGLTISRQICENFGFSLDYRFISPHHHFIVGFNDQIIK